MMMMMMMMTLMKNLLVDLVKYLESSWNLMAHSDAREGKWRGNWRMEWIASTLHATSELGVSSITTADAHTSAARSRLNWRPRRFKWTRPFSPKDEIWFLRVCHHVSYPGIWCCISQHDAQWNQQTIFTVTIHKHTHTHTDLILILCAIFTILFSHLHSTLHTKKHISICQFCNISTTDTISSTQFSLSVSPLKTQQFFTPYLYLCAFLN